jgi:hypothetical protein
VHALYALYARPQTALVAAACSAAGKTYVGILLVKALLANTCNTQSTTTAAADARPGMRPPPPPPAAAAGGHRKPDIGPILMVTVTNHAIDSLMEGLLDAGVAARPGQMIRVGGRSKSERLQPYNLREVSRVCQSVESSC